MRIRDLTISICDLYKEIEEGIDLSEINDIINIIYVKANKYIFDGVIGDSNWIV